MTTINDLYGSSKNVLWIVQEFCRRRALPIPTQVFGSLDETTNQLQGLLQEGLQDIAGRHDWPHLTKEVSFQHGSSVLVIPSSSSSEGGVVTGVLVNIGPASIYPRNSVAATWNPAWIQAAETAGAAFPGCRGIVKDTLWDTSARLPVLGPLTPVEWMNLTTRQLSAARYHYRVSQGCLLIYPVPAAGQSPTFRVSIFTNLAVYSETGVEPVGYFAADTDVSAFSTELHIQDLRWRYNAAKGLSYAEDQRICEEMIANELLRVGGPWPDLTLDSPNYDGSPGPGIIIQPGSWPVR